MSKSRSDYDPVAFAALAERLGFGKKTRPVLEQAMTHPAFFEGSRKDRQGDNQRLEFLGDAVLDLIIGEYLFLTYPEAQEGELSKMRAYIVCEASLAAAARQLGLDRALRLGRGSEAGGDRQRASVLADAYEAMIGAVFVSQGFGAARRLLVEQFADQVESLTPDVYEDKKSLLQEIVQQYAPHGVSYRLLSTSGPDHQPRFETGVYCGKLLLGQGEGGSKKESETAAAAAALDARQQWLDEIRG